MLNLLVTLTPISLIDSLSIVPFAVVVLAVLLSGPSPYLSSVSFLLGTALSYFAAGVLIVVGLGGVIGQATDALVHWFKNPDAVDYVLSIVIGIGLIVLGYRWATMRRQRAESKPVEKSMTPLQAFALGAGTTVAGLWGALPYFAAIDQILKAGVSSWLAVAALAYYNLIFISISAALVLARALLGARADGIFETVNRLFAVWGKRVLIVLMVLLGLVMVADGVGWLFGYPLVPVD
jgi:cytochrome c biogenesis protein CcdA